ncbi:MAG: hypothetical protein KGH49_02895 [Candidatus Micrarchaeota archaeon]|nr:hypothetical protein [Candidatus Micrarchaeota archaeon]
MMRGLTLKKESESKATKQAIEALKGKLEVKDTLEFWHMVNGSDIQSLKTYDFKPALRGGRLARVKRTLMRMMDNGGFIDEIDKE